MVYFLSVPAPYCNEVVNSEQHHSAGLRRLSSLEGQHYAWNEAILSMAQPPSSSHAACKVQEKPLQWDETPVLVGR